MSASSCPVPPPSSRRRGCSCSSAKPEACHGPEGWVVGVSVVGNCLCACHGGPDPEPLLVEEPVPAPSRSTDGATRETWELAEIISGAASLKRARYDVDPETWDRTCELAKGIRAAVRAEAARLPRFIDRPELDRAKPERPAYPFVASLELTPDVVAVLEKVEEARTAAGGLSWESLLTECRRVVRATGSAS